VFHADRQTDGLTDMTKVIVAFRNFANAPRKFIGNEQLMLLGRLISTCNLPVLASHLVAHFLTSAQEKSYGSIYDKHRGSVNYGRSHISIAR
jgi:hypothetical protein